MLSEKLVFLELAFKTHKQPQQALAKSLGVTARTIRYWKTKTHAPKVASVIKVAARVSYYHKHRVIRRVAKGYAIDSKTGEKKQRYMSSAYRLIKEKKLATKELNQKIENPETESEEEFVLTSEEWAVTGI